MDFVVLDSTALGPGYAPYGDGPGYENQEVELKALQNIWEVPIGANCVTQMQIMLISCKCRLGFRFILNMRNKQSPLIRPLWKVAKKMVNDLYTEKTKAKNKQTIKRDFFVNNKIYIQY